MRFVAGPRWHSELLNGATEEIAHVRPAILPEGALAQLVALLRFRHFLRHAYTVEFDLKRLTELADDLAATHPTVVHALRRC